MDVLEWDEKLIDTSLHPDHITYGGEDKKTEWWGCADCDIRMVRKK